MGCGASRTAVKQLTGEVGAFRKQLSLTFVDNDGRRSDRSKHHDARSLLLKLDSRELEVLINELEGGGGRQDGTVSRSESSISSVSSETDKERHRKAGFSNKAIKITGRPQETWHGGIGFACKKGLKPESPNQDSFVIVRVEGRYSIFGVFDGHGSKGHDVSDYVKDQFSKVLVTQADLETDPAHALETAFKTTQSLVEEATSRNRIDARRSGCTATVVYHHLVTNTVFVAHVGDSRAVLGEREDGAGYWRAQDLTEDHKPNLPAERTRIEGAGGQVLFDGCRNYRVYIRGKRYPGLNMSRAMGDLLGYWDAGISAVPDIQIVVVDNNQPMGTPVNGCNPAVAEAHSAGCRAPKLAAAIPGTIPSQAGSCGSAAGCEHPVSQDIGGSQEPSKRRSSTGTTNEPFCSDLSGQASHGVSDRLLLICTDGVWDFIDSQEAVEIISSFLPDHSMQAAEELAYVAWERWIDNSGGLLVDDITTLVIRLDAHARVSSAGRGRWPAGEAQPASAPRDLADMSPLGGAVDADCHHSHSLT